MVGQDLARGDHRLGRELGGQGDLVGLKGAAVAHEGQRSVDVIGLLPMRTGTRSTQPPRVASCAGPGDTGWSPGRRAIAVRRLSRSAGDATPGSAQVQAAGGGVERLDRTLQKDLQQGVELELGRERVP